MSTKRKRLSYDASFKLRVIEFAESESNAAAEREFGVSEKLVRD
jgi:transposase-like protein